MEFKKENVYTALNADESLIGAKGYFADNLYDLKYSGNLRCFTSIIEDRLYPDNNTIAGSGYNFFYLVEPAPAKPKYRPFEDCDELIETYKEERCLDLGEHELPIIWVRPIGGNTGGDMITDFNATSVRVLGNWWSLRDLLKVYTFLDGSTCGVKE